MRGTGIKREIQRSSFRIEPPGSSNALQQGRLPATVLPHKKSNLLLKSKPFQGAYHRQIKRIAPEGRDRIAQQLDMAQIQHRAID